MSMTGVQMNASPGFGEEHPSPHTRFSAMPAAQGLYDPAAEKDACGLAMIASLKNQASHEIVAHALMGLLYGVAAGISVLSVFFDVAYRSILPSILPADELLCYPKLGMSERADEAMRRDLYLRAVIDRVRH